MKLINGMAISLLTLLASNAWAYQEFTDRALFAASFENPTNLIDFSHLKDGTVFRTDWYLPSPLIHSTSSPPFAAMVRQEGWSDDVLIGSSYFGCGCGWSATNWFGDRIDPAGYGYYNSIYLNFTGESMPVTFETSVGFRGYIPDSLTDSYFLLPNFASVTSIQYGYSAVSTVPEPTTLALLIAGLALLIGLKFPMVRTRNVYQRALNTAALHQHQQQAL